MVGVVGGALVVVNEESEEFGGELVALQLKYGLGEYVVEVGVARAETLEVHLQEAHDHVKELHVSARHIGEHVLSLDVDAARRRVRAHVDEATRHERLWQCHEQIVEHLGEQLQVEVGFV